MTSAAGPAEPLRIRRAVRAVLVDPHHRVLLVRFEFPDASVWGLPGGGVEPGEEPEAALRRELLEELGLVDAPIGPHVWDRLHIVPFISGLWDGQREQIHLVEVDEFDPAPTLTWEQLNAEYVFELRWWTIDEVRASDAGFAPAALADLLHHLVDDGPPATPLDTGV
jgi:8-oxo-dGTP diphosphatase